MPDTIETSWGPILIQPNPNLPKNVIVLVGTADDEED